VYIKNEPSAEVDNVTYALMLGERVRTRLEQHSRVALVHVGLLVVAVPFAVWMTSLMSPFSPVVCFWFGGMVEAVATAASGGDVARACKDAAKVTGSWLLGMFVYGALFNSSVSAQSPH
jgi:hypothetical protein